jgi:hypothetical protein
MSGNWSDLQNAWWKVGPTWAGIFNPETWRPDPAVFIGTSNFAGNTIGEIVIRRGRDSVYVEPAASYASVNLISVTDPLNITVGRPLQITVATTTGFRESLFRGRISDIEVQITPGTTKVAGYRLTAVGPLADANRRQVLAAGRAQELDGERALAAILGGVAQTWETQSASLEWGDAVGVWNDFIGDVAIDQFDDGVFDVSALPVADGGYSALGVAQESAASGGGVLYETRDGRIAYADASRRALTFAAGDFEEISGNILELDGMNASSALSEVSNRVQVEWAGGVETAEVRESIIQFGVLERTFRTVLAVEGDAQTRAEQLAQELSLPVFKTDVFTLLLNNADGPLRDRLVRVEPNDGVDFVGLPPALGFTRLTAFVEGVEWRIGQFTAELGLFTSDERLSVGSVWWGRVDDTLEWGNVDAALEWQDVGRTL